LAVKFNFEGLDDDNEERWLELDCVSCNIDKIDAGENATRCTDEDHSSDGEEEVKMYVRVDG